MRTNRRLFVDDSPLLAMMASALAIGGRNVLFDNYTPQRPLPPNPLDEATRERIANEAIAKADQRQLRRLQRKQADRERPKYKEGGK